MPETGDWDQFPLFWIARNLQLILSVFAQGTLKFCVVVAQEMSFSRGPIAAPLKGLLVPICMSYALGDIRQGREVLPFTAPLAMSLRKICRRVLLLGRNLDGYLRLVKALAVLSGGVRDAVNHQPQVSILL
ncbi:MAG: hypothetical protein ABJJ53_01835 [Sulfitobacter sp.]